MVYEVLAASGLVFWIVVVAAVALVAVPLGSDNPSGGLWIAGLAIFLLLLLTDAVSRVGVWILLLIVPLYVLIGVGWALFKWRCFVLTKKSEAAEKWAKKRDTDWPAMTREQVMAEFRPRADRNKDRIVGWIALWPWSMSWVVLRFPWRAIVWTYERISTVFERWSKSLWEA